MIPSFPFDSFFDGVPAARPGPQPAPPLPADVDLALRVADRLGAYLDDPGKHIVVEVQNQVVILEGMVNTDAYRTQAHRLVWETPGVADVCNELATWEDG